jgi:hypothetical protein
MPKSPQEWAESVIKNLPERTGRSLEQWIELVKKSGLTKSSEIVAWLKSEHNLGQNTAYMISYKITGDYDDPEALLDAMYSGGKEALRPLYESLIKMAEKLGDDLTVYQCKTYTVLRRSRQFAVIKPTTKTRIDVGFALPGLGEQGRLELAKNLGGGDRITHKVSVESGSDIDNELFKWLKASYEMDPPAAAISHAKSRATLFK